MVLLISLLGIGKRFQKKIKTIKNSKLEKIKNKSKKKTKQTY